MLGWAIDWQRGDDERLRITEPTDAEVAAVAPRLASFYNDPHNRRLLANTITLSEADVLDVYRDCRAAGGRPLLLWRNLSGAAPASPTNQTCCRSSISPHR